MATKAIAKEPNMYGYYPCPKCGSEYRYALQKEPEIALCDDCGHREEVASVYDEERANDQSDR